MREYIHEFRIGQDLLSKTQKHDTIHKKMTSWTLLI